MRRYLPFIALIWGAAIILHAGIKGFAFSGNGYTAPGLFSRSSSVSPWSSRVVAS